MQKIMFNDKYGLTQAVLAGWKTQTRRIARISQHAFELLSGLYPEAPKELVQSVLKANSRYDIGEVVAIAQKYSEVINPIDWVHTKMYEGSKAWNNKMFVRPDLMPHRIKITGIRAERLQNISDEDCMAEGVQLNKRQYDYDGTKRYVVEGIKHWRSIGCTEFDTPREAFAALIDRTSGKGTWQSNPFVFVYEYTLIK